jgi:signal transduction histidine kinase
MKHHPHPLMIEVSHQVNSPLAAIRNAIYLASKRTEDPEIIEYLAIADDEITSIVNRIRDLRAEVEATCVLGPPVSALAPGPDLEEAA